MRSDWLDVSRRNISPTYKCFSGELALGLFSHVLFLRAKPGVLGTVEVSTVVPNSPSTPSVTHHQWGRKLLDSLRGHIT